MLRRITVASLPLAALLSVVAVACSSGNSPSSGDDGGPRVDASSDANAKPDSTAADGVAPIPDASEGGPADVAATDAAGGGDGPQIDAADGASADEAGDALADVSTDGADAFVDAGYPCPDDGGVPMNGIPNELRCTGLYSDWATKTVAPDVTPYTPGVILWSDGADKTRWLWLPPGTQIDTTNMDEWSFPVGTKIWKQFVVGGKLVETRMIWKRPDLSIDGTGWVYTVYLWSSDQASTALLTTGETNVNGTTYEVPATWMCGHCHGGRNDFVMGLDLIGTGIPAAQGITLATLVSEGLLTQPPPATQIVIPEDATKKAAPALAWLHMNCGVSCHNGNAKALAKYTGLRMKLLASELFPDAGAATVAGLDTYTTAVNVMSNLSPNGMPYMRIAPSDSDASLIPLLDMARDPNGVFLPMPPLVSHTADTADVALVKAWIDAMPK